MMKEIKTKVLKPSPKKKLSKKQKREINDMFALPEENENIEKDK